MSPITRKPVFGVCDQVDLNQHVQLHRLASLENLDLASAGRILSQQTTKTLIRLRGCAG